MLYFERVIYEDIKNDCICHELEFLLEANKSQIEKYAHDNGVNPRDVIKQIKLHAPQFEKKFYTIRSFLKKHIFPILDVVFADFHEKFSKYIDLCGANTIHKPAHIEWIERGKNDLTYDQFSDKKDISFTKVMYKTKKDLMRIRSVRVRYVLLKEKN